MSLFLPIVIPCIVIPFLLAMCMPSGKALTAYTIFLIAVCFYLQNRAGALDVSGPSAISLLVMSRTIGVSGFVGVIMKILSFCLKKIEFPKVIRIIVPCLGGLLLSIITVKILFFT